MTTDTRTENDALIEALRRNHVPDHLEAGGIYGYKLDTHVHIVDLNTEEYLDEPKRKTGTVTVDDVAAFAQYYAKHADADSEVYANIDAGTITAVLDAHEDVAPRWQQHRLVLQLTHTDQWKTWRRGHRAEMPQLAFSEHIEDNLTDIAPDPVPAAEMLEIAQTFQAKTSVSYASGTRLSTGAINLRYEETTDASGGAKGNLTVPREFAIGIAPFDDVDPYRINVRLRYRIEGSKLKLCYILDRPEDVVRDAVETVVAKVEEATGIKVMRGTPA